MAGDLTKVLNLDNLKVSKDDIVAIAVAKREGELELELRNAQKALGQNEREQDRLQEELLKALGKHADEQDTEKYRRLADEISALGFGETKTETRAFIEEGNEDRPAELVLAVSITTEHGVWTGVLRKEERVPLASVPAVAEIVEAHRQAQSAAAVLREKALEVKKELAQLPSLERKTRAALAVEVLRNTEDGQALLRKLASVGSDPLLLEAE